MNISRKELAPYFDFMLITHNHGDHCNEELYAAMNKVVHPCCGIKTEEGVKKLNPKLTAIGHVCELGHKKWRVPWELGYKVKGWVEAAGYKAAVPMWGERIDNII